jgi:hypothetical protein
MNRSKPKHSFRPARCPGCDYAVHLLVGNSSTITVQVHTARGCNETLYYRCWIEQGLPIPRVEFVDPQNAQHFTLRPHGVDEEPTTVADPLPLRSSARQVFKSRRETRVPASYPKTPGHPRRPR